MFRLAKTYGHDLGLSCCYRQHNSHSHCRFLHGYALAVRLEFIAEELDDGWVLDFGGLKEPRQQIVDMLDHKCLVSIDDPQYEAFRFLEQKGLIQMKTMKIVSCEAIAETIFHQTVKWLMETSWYPRVRLASVTVREHGANEATFLDVVHDVVRELVIERARAISEEVNASQRINA